jgi:tetratricopeptide (TPR) repeat protein
MSKHYWFWSVFSFAVLLLMPKLFQIGLRNIAFISIQRTTVREPWTAWGLGLRAVPSPSISTLLIQPTQVWAGDKPLGVAPFLGENLLNQFNDCDSHRLIAQRYMAQSQWGMARGLLELVAQACPSYAFAHLELGLVYDRLQRPELAVAAFEAGGVSAFGRELAAANYLILARGCDGQTPELERERCVRWLTRALELAPEHIFAALRLAQVTSSTPLVPRIDPNLSPLFWNDRRLNDLVIEGFFEWAKQNPLQRRELLLSVARQLALRKDYRRALAIYQSFRSETLDDAWLSYYTGWAAGALDQWVLADTYFSRAVQQSPQTVNFWVAQAQARIKLNDQSAAVYGYRQALSLEPCILEAIAYLKLHPELIPVVLTPQEEENCLKHLTVRYEAEKLPTLANAEIKMDDAASEKLVMAGRNGFVVYGPYQFLPAGHYQVTFRIQPLQPVRAGCLQLDVSAETDQSDGSWLIALPIHNVKSNELPERQYTNKTLSFYSLGGGRFEYRVFEQCGSEVWIDWIEITPIQ